MNKLTPTFADLHKAQANGAGPNPQVMHVVPPHEPTREGETVHLTMSPGPTPVAVPAPAPLKIALIGTAPSSRMLAPFNDPSWKIWACSPGNMNQLPRVDVWYELHSNLLWPEHESYGRPYIEWLKQQKFPVWMQDQSLIPHAQVFPKNELVEEFGDDFFTSSFAWMMAHAMKQGAVEIALYGIDMASRDEYIRQRPGFFFFRYLCERRGIKVSAPHESDIMQSPPLYAYVDSTPFGRKILARRTEVIGRVNGMVQQRDQLNNSITYLQGAQEDLDYFESIWSGVCNEQGKLQYRNAQLEQENAALKAKIAELMAPKMVFQPVSTSMQSIPLTTYAANSGSASAPEPAEKPVRRRGRKPAPQPESPAA